MRLRNAFWLVRHVLHEVGDLLSTALLRDGLRLAASRSRLLRLTSTSGAVVGRNVEVIGLERLTIGSGTVIQSNVTLHCGGMGWTADQGGIRIGSNTFIGHGCVLYGAGGIIVGDDGLLSPGVVVASHQHSFTVFGIAMRVQPIRSAPVTIEDDVWIGASATILPGVRIGRGAIVAAGAVVVDSVEPYTMVAGVPARPFRKRSPNPSPNAGPSCG